MAQNGSTLTEERIAYIEEMVQRGKAAAAVFTQYTQEDVDRIVKAMVLAGLDQAERLARLAIEETRLGVLEDKALKNMVATEFVYDYVRDKRTVGVIREFPERGVVEFAEPIGLIFSVTPITNPTSTVLFKCIMAIKTRNAVHLRPPPESLARCSRRSGADHVRNGRCRTWRAGRRLHLPGRSPTLADNVLPDAAQGCGASSTPRAVPESVKAAYSSGKPALGVGAGNTPVYLEKIGGPRHGGGRYHHVQDF